MKTLKLDEKQAVKLYPNAAPEFKALLESKFGIELFNKKITDRIKSMSDVYEALGIDEDEFENDREYRAEKMAEFAKKIGMQDEDISEDEPCFLIRDFNIYALAYVLNEEWIPDYSNTNERKWYPYFSLSSGFVFSDSAASSGFRLCFKSEELANYAGKNFTKYFKKYIINK
jgi:hypothetical protein